MNGEGIIVVRARKEATSWAHCHWRCRVFYIWKQNADALMQKWDDDFPLLFQVHWMWMLCAVKNVYNQFTDTHTETETRRMSMDDDGFLQKDDLSGNKPLSALNRQRRRRHIHIQAHSCLLRVRPSMQQMHEIHVSVAVDYAKLLCC